MARFDYLEGADAKKSARKAAKKARKKAAEGAPRADAWAEPGPGTAERLEAVYVRKETVRAVWREVKREGGESVSELVEDLLLSWLREHTR